ncbi:glucose dehydrogenase [FAD, quinone]-like [Stegodyphus dumicola]|uniref:glucose dehydrogenase [FAD, quinone]-like n=1 Tax=Stegodyphus dumicola TaxID=202533 RepID=UPI0015B1F167|nr:glucose dehydrogenase [FAD, quinone]-like [Stegodyphus dumicola]
MSYNLAVEASCPTPYAASQFLSIILLSMAGQRHAPKTTNEIKSSYDYIIVGGGSAGSVLAARLSEKPCVTVLLLEAGKSPPKVSDIPAVAKSFIKSDIDWFYSTAPQEYTGAGLINREVAWPSGKTLGGSSVINAMLNVRGNKKDFDDWAAQGARGWNYDKVLPYFKKLEDNANPEYVKNVLDSNGPTQTGFYDLQATIRRGQRCSAAKAYLVPSDQRENLDIVAEAFVKKIIIHNHQAQGVIFDFEGKERKVRAFKEVILSAGTVNSAQLLMLSGIGPQEELEKFNIPLVADLPVGRNLQDHCLAVLPYEMSDKPFEEKQKDQSSIWDYIVSKTGPLTSAQGVNTIAFLDKDEPKAPGDYPDYQLYIFEAATGPAKTQQNIKPEYYEAIYGPYENSSFYCCAAQMLHPKARGTITLKSSDPYDPPVIDPKYFSHPEDKEIVTKGMKKCHEIASSEPLKKIGSKPFSTVVPGCEDYIYDDDKYFRCIAESIVVTLNHQVGTAKMGNPKDTSTVVDPELRVKMVHNLRVVDASVMPLITSGNTNVPTMMVAEKASDIIKQNIHCETEYGGWNPKTFWGTLHQYFK